MEYCRTTLRDVRDRDTAAGLAVDEERAWEWDVRGGEEREGVRLLQTDRRGAGRCAGGRRAAGVGGGYVLRSGVAP